MVFFCGESGAFSAKAAVEKNKNPMQKIQFSRFIHPAPFVKPCMLAHVKNLFYRKRHCLL
ncbi:hypothetical protein Llon_0058 [Legionella londiniensis]|uniref:Uncharacterized protein n=1 Tax=Legionella londiniensis TaxID=45068 RepID=A0A0W0VT82_9GAMM|nr:hypothetical protein Llon_0058 [Legionella londiniensis]